MFFILSKTLNYLTMPVVILLALAGYSVFSKNKRWKNRSLKIGFILLLIFTNDFLTNEFALLWEVPATPFNSIKKKYEYGILLTGVTKEDMKPADRIYFKRGADRVYHTVQLYKLGIISKILVSGGNGKLLSINRPEADDISDALKIMGVAASDILIENKSRNTHESAQLINKDFAGKINPNQCILITSAYHIKRARACFVKLGWTLDTFSADFISHPRNFSVDIILPSPEAFVNWHTLIREWTGMIAYRVAGYV